MSDRLNELEWKLLEGKLFDEYKSFIDRSRSIDKENLCSNIRYMMALSNTFNENSGEGEYMFIGGMGVLGNLVSHLGMGAIFNSRDIHDLDLVIKYRDYEFLLGTFLDDVYSYNKSLSIKDKLSFSGSCYDIEDKFLPRARFDVYFPNGNPKKGTEINYTIIDENKWEKVRKVDFFGVPINFVDPLTLLSTKLNINSGSRNSREKKDDYDIINLLGVAEKDKYSTLDLEKNLSTDLIRKLKEFIKEKGKEKNMLNPSEDYLTKILSIEV